MNKKIIIGSLAGAVVLLGGIIITLTSNQSSPFNSSAASNDSAVKLVAINACDLFTLDEAKQILGSDTTESGNVGPSGNEDISVDTCSYTNNKTTADSIRIATVMVRSALTAKGMDDNEGAFEDGGTARPANAEEVKDLGSKAYWDPSTYQLAILKDNSWISIVYGGTNPTKNTLSDAKKVAEKVIR